MSRRNKRNKGNHVTLTLRSPFCHFCYFGGTISISCGKFFCPTEIKEILLPARCEAISAISAISVGHYYLMRIVFYCPAVIGFAASLVEEIKEIKEIFISLGEALSAISAITAGQLLPHAESFFSHGNKGNQGNLHPPRRSTFCTFCHFCGTIIISCG